MAFIARIEGTYRYRVRTKILWFWVVQPWKTAPFSWEKSIDVPNLSLDLFRLPSAPLSVALDADEEGAHFGLKLMDGLQAWGRRIAVPTASSIPFRFEPWKGVVIEGTASYREA